MTNADNSRWAYGYDALGQVTAGKKYWSDGGAVAGQQFEYTFDDIGNRKTTASGGDQSGANLRSASYSANSLNQYTSRVVPGYVELLGEATNTATVTVNNQATYRKGSYFRKELAVDNGAASVWQSVTNLAVLNNGTNADIVAETTGNLFVPQTPESIGYDADGNMTNDGRWMLTWDGENRLTKAESLASGPAASKRKVEWTYDYGGRRVRQTTSDGSSGSYMVAEDLKFVSDGWRHLAELNATNNTLIRSYAWGLDLSGSLDGAGGVGGLLMLNSTANGFHFYAYDGNGNVAALVKASDGTTSANYEYDPFGGVLRATGLMADENRFQFSTKRNDRTTDFEMYEYRIRRPDLSWLSRDPLEEGGGLNLYAFVWNDPLNKFDLFGLDGKCSEATTKDGRPVIVYDDANHWTLTSVDFVLFSTFSAVTVIKAIKISWEANIYVKCCCAGGSTIRTGKRTHDITISYTEAEEVYVYQAGSMPITIPTFKSMLSGIGKVIGGGIKSKWPKAISMTMADAQRVVDQIKGVWPMTPSQGKWNGGSPCK